MCVKILLTGSDGQIGTELRLLLADHPTFDLTATTRAQLDICDADQIAAVISASQPDVVINAAAYTAVDAAENDEDASFAVNSTGPELLAKACSLAQSVLMHISTDFVFDGKQREPYKESAGTNPLNVYGKSKAAGEAKVRKYCPAHIILRTSWVYSPWGNNFLKTMLRLMAGDKPLRIVGDQAGSPTAAADAAAAIVKIIEELAGSESPAYGTLHYCGSGSTNWFGFARQIAATYTDLTGQPIQLEEIKSSEYPTAAERPPYSVLNCERIQEIFSVTALNWQAAVDRETRRLVAMQTTDNTQ
jgi:dTDP-4-dehydrorhamnose reductase